MHYAHCCLLVTTCSFYRMLFAAIYYVLPALTKHEVRDLEMEMVVLPARHGGLSFDNYVEDSPRKHAVSLECTAHLTAQIATGGSELFESVRLDQATKSAVQTRHCAALEAKAADMQDCLPRPQQRAVSLAREKGEYPDHHPYGRTQQSGTLLFVQCVLCLVI